MSFDNSVMLSCLLEKRVMMAALLKFSLNKPWLPEAGLILCVWPCLKWVRMDSLACSVMDSVLGICVTGGVLPRSILFWQWGAYKPLDSLMALFSLYVSLWYWVGQKVCSGWIFLANPIVLLVNNSLKSFDLHLVKMKFL